MSDPGPPDPGASPAGRPSPAPLAVLGLILLLTVMATFIVRGFVQQQQAARFELRVGAYERELRQRLQNYGTLLNAARAAWEASDTLTGPQFERLVAGLDLPTRYPGLRSVGYAPLIRAADRTFFAGQLPYLTGLPAVTVHPPSSLPVSVPIVFLSPADASNRNVIGFDMYTDATRRKALDAAIQSGEVTATGRVMLANTSLTDRRGILLFLATRVQGRVVGVLYVPVQLSAVLPASGALASEQLSLWIALDGQLLSGSQKQSGAGQAAFHQRHVLDFSGQQWTLDFSASPGFGLDSVALLPWMVLVVGVLVGVLAALATQAQVRARRRAEEISRRLTVSQSRLERSRAELGAVFRAMQDIAIFADTSGRILFANDASEQLFGLRPDELRGSRLADLHQDTRLLDRLDALPGPHLVTTLFRRRGGQSFYGEMQRSSVLGEHGEVLGQLEVIRDISERLQADRLRREGERRYQGVLEAMPQIVFLTDAAGMLTYVNRRWTDYVGPLESAPTAPRSGVVDLISVLHPDDRAEFGQRWQAAMQGGHDLEIEHRLRSRSGVYRTFVTRGRPVRGEHGEVLEWVASSTDIDDQVYAEVNSRLLADFSQVLSARVPDEACPEQGGVSQPGSPDSGLVQALRLLTSRFADVAVLWQTGEAASEAAEVPAPWSLPGWGLPGHSPPLMVGQARLTAHPDDATLGSLRELVERLLHRHEPTVMQSERLHDYGLSAAMFFPLSRAPLPGAALDTDEVPDSEAPLGLLALGFRQTLGDREPEVGQELALRLTTALDNRRLLDRLQLAQNSLQDLNNSLEQRVLERTAQLREANSELEAFSYSVSHDLRTPLRHILGFAELFRKESGADLSSKGQRYLGVMTDAASRMSALIDDLLEFSRTSRTELRLSRVDLTEVVRSSIQGMAPDQGERAVTWRVEPLPVISGDPALLRQVFDNLLSNALKYTRPREQAIIEVESRQVEQELWIGVRDNGVGFDPAYVDKLFGVFQRLHRSDEFEGTGIGLANVRRIVARHGGRVWAESGVPGKPGATFWLALPLGPYPPSTTAASTSEATTPEESPHESRPIPERMS
ncbi:CHASE domain-containing protein [Deinococcus sp. KNUC1210]|uniref:CHASE domain-containing protein n=1 Tax=Deinococcus sp. KNUC1210 TaxID=2917691 RepID=UPI001EF046AD|nr:CHASE domain-containing protein [Deinococcus sp. KNUC1210]ULH16720.1 CHASE domain-containing protein [Deinococcus sp. KNUC1210]